MMTTLEVIYALDPRVFERARRLTAAIELLQAGANRRDVSGAIRRRFAISQMHAWRIVDMAHDMAGKIK